MIDSIKQKLEKLNPIKPTSLKKAGVFIGILYHDEFIENPEVIFTQRSAKSQHIQVKLVFLEGNGKKAIRIYMKPLKRI